MFCKRLTRWLIGLALAGLLLATGPVLRTGARASDPPAPEDEGGMPFPEWQPPLQKSETAHYGVMYNLETGETRVIPTQRVPDVLTAAATTSHFALPRHVTEDGSLLGSPEGRAPANPAAPLDFDTLTQVVDTDVWPWRAHTKLRMTFPSGSTAECSGTLVDASHVTTAGHCVWSFENASKGWYPCNAPATACWATTIEVIPGYNNGSEPYGTANSAWLYTWTGWTADRDYDWDLALIRLDRPVGALTGWYAYGYHNDTFFDTHGFRNTGYPGDDPYDGELMYTWYGTFDDIQTHRLYHNDQGFGGQSGSGTYYFEFGGSDIVYAVLSHGTSTPPIHTGHTRINADKFNLLGAWINEGTPGQADLVPLDVNVTPATLDRGDQLAAMDYLIHNYSSVTWSGSVSVRVYLSPDNDITTGDRRINTRTFTGSIGPKDEIRVNATSNLPVIPGDICGSFPWSNYWIGVILDISDANTANNDTDTWDAAPIKINPCDVYEPDDTSGQARTINSGTPQTHDIIPATDVDWVKFTLSQEAPVVLETSGASGDTHLWLYDSSVNYLADDDDSGTSYFSRIERTCGVNALPAGTYYARIEEHGNNQKISDYQVTLTVGAACGSSGDMYEPDDTAGEATLLVAGSAQTHSIVPAGDVDWYRFSVSQESAVTLETFGTSGDTEMWLYNSSLNQLDYDDDAGADAFSYIDRVCGADALGTGTYYARVGEYGNNAEIAGYGMRLTVAPCRRLYLPLTLRSF